MTPETTAVALATINLIGVLIDRLKAIGLFDQEEALDLLQRAEQATAAALDVRGLSAAVPLARSLLQPVEDLLRRRPDPSLEYRPAPGSAEDQGA